MNSTIKNIELEDKIFSVNAQSFTAVALELFQYQYKNNLIYQKYCDSLKINISNINCIHAIPFLPISFFKTHIIKTTDFDASIIFESSGTTQTINSKHFVKDISIYTNSFTKAFDLFYSNEYCILALLPSYLERKNSSLVMMADRLIQKSNNPLSGFYLNNFNELQKTILQLEKEQKKTILLGATFALLDFAEQCPIAFQHTTIMETGGMKGRRKEMTRQEVHEILCRNFKVKKIHSEYGMTELLSQAYSKGDGIFNCPPWMKILIREEDDPLNILNLPSSNSITTGAINIIDLANIYSSAFIATEDAGKLYADESFEVIGRMDNSTIRGCSLLTL